MKLRPPINETKENEQALLENLCIFYTFMYIALIKSEVKFNPKIKKLKDKDIENKTVATEMSVKSESA